MIWFVREWGFKNNSECLLWNTLWTGPGLFESVYEGVLIYELIILGLDIERQKPIPVILDGITIDQSFRADLIVNNKVLIEIKSIQSIERVHK